MKSSPKPTADPFGRLLAPLVWSALWIAAALGVAGLAERDQAGSGRELLARSTDPGAEWAWSELASTLQIPLWNPFEMGGIALLPTSEFRLFYPLAWPLALPFSWAFCIWF